MESRHGTIHNKYVRSVTKSTSERAAVAQLGERQTEDLKVPGSIPGGGILIFVLRPFNLYLRYK